MSQTMRDLFARVRPLVGDALEGCQVAIVGSVAASTLVEYLVACGLRHWLVMADNSWMGALVAKLRQRYGDEFGLSVEVANSVAAFGGVDLALVVDDVVMVHALPITLTRLAIFTPNDQRASRAMLALPGERLELPAHDYENSGPLDRWDWHTSAPLMALFARALLLAGTKFAMRTWETIWASGERGYIVGATGEPTSAKWLTDTGIGEIDWPFFRTPSQRRGTLLIAGLGSLGSVAARHLAPFFERMILVDPDQVEVTNLVRQAYTHGQIGVAKAVALAESLCADDPGLACEALVAALQDEDQVSALVTTYGVTAALVTTGTQADFAIARALREAGVPHVVGRCYARARFWEGIVVDGAQGLSYEQVRRTVAMGPTPIPTAEQLAAYGAVGDLAAEPATAMETGWAAAWLARLVSQIASPVPLREGWLLARLAAGASCFVGGVVVEQGMELDVNRSAYGVEVPGQVHAWSVTEIA